MNKGIMTLEQAKEINKRREERERMPISERIEAEKTIIELEKKKAEILEAIKNEDPAETAARRNRIRIGTATVEDFEKEGMEVESTKKEEVDRFEKLLQGISEIAENTKNTLSWVRFWSILSIIGFVIALIAIIAAI